MKIFKEHQTGALYAFLSAGLFAMFNLAVKFSKPYLTIWQMMFGRSLLCLIVMAFIARWIGLNLLGQRRKILIVTGLTGMGAVISIMLALLLLPLFEALVLIYLYPIFAALASPRLTGEKMGPYEWMLIGFAFGGMILVLWSGHVGGRLQWGHLFGLTAAFMYGLTLTFIRLLSSKNNPLIPIFYICVAGCIFCIAPLLFQDAPFQIGINGFIGIFAITTLATLAQLAGNKALSLLPSPKVGVISMSEIVIGALCGFFLFSESLSWRSLIGGILIIGSGICISIRPNWVR